MKEIQSFLEYLRRRDERDDLSKVERVEYYALCMAVFALRLWRCGVVDQETHGKDSFRAALLSVGVQHMHLVLATIAHFETPAHVVVYGLAEVPRNFRKLVWENFTQLLSAEEVDAATADPRVNALLNAMTTGSATC